MEAIKKKMQSMKVEKDNLCDRCDEVEQVRVRGRPQDMSSLLILPTTACTPIA